MGEINAFLASFRPDIRQILGEDDTRKFQHPEVTVNDRTEIVSNGDQRGSFRGV